MRGAPVLRRRAHSPAAAALDREPRAARDSESLTCRQDPGARVERDREHRWCGLGLVALRAQGLERSRSLHPRLLALVDAAEVPERCGQPRLGERAVALGLVFAAPRQARVVAERAFREVGHDVERRGSSSRWKRQQGRPRASRPRRRAPSASWRSSARFCASCASFMLIQPTPRRPRLPQTAPRNPRRSCARARAHVGCRLALALRLQLPLRPRRVPRARAACRGSRAPP